VRLTVVGCSPAWPNAGGAHSGYLVEGAGAALFDCGPGVLARLRNGKLWPEVDAIAITHFHLDHWGDLVPWVWGASYLEGRDQQQPRPVLLVPPEGQARLEVFGSQLGFPDMFERIFVLSEYEPDTPFVLAGFTVTASRVPHYKLDAYAFRITDGTRTLAYSGDSGPSDVLSDVARDADLFVCEATLASGAHDGQPRGHLALDEAQAAFDRSGAKRLLVTHRPDELATDAGLELAYDGMVCEV
jgi:ribonuclease BN (tRNA processing enzyme)